MRWALRLRSHHFCPAAIAHRFGVVEAQQTKEVCRLCVCRGVLRGDGGDEFVIHVVVLFWGLSCVGSCLVMLFVDNLVLLHRPHNCIHCMARRVCGVIGNIEFVVVVQHILEQALVVVVVGVQCCFVVECQQLVWGKVAIIEVVGFLAVFVQVGVVEGVVDLFVVIKCGLNVVLCVCLGQHVEIIACEGIEEQWVVCVFG